MAKELRRVVKNPKGFSAINFETDPLGTRYVKIFYRAKGRFAKILKRRKEKIIRLTKNSKVLSIHNHTPDLNSVTIKYKKRKVK
jgi:hypothetical protein